MTVKHFIKTITAAALLAPVTPRAAESPELELRTAPAPFTADGAGGGPQEHKPSVSGNRITYGDKELIINDNGSLVINSSGRELARLYFYFKTHDFITLRNAKGVKMTQDGGAFVFDIKVPLLKDGAETLDFQERVELLENGMVSVRTRWTTNPAPAAQVGESQMWIEFPAHALSGEKIVADGRESIPPDDNKWAFFEARNPSSVTVCPGKPDRVFSFDLTGCRMAVGWTHNQQTYIRLGDNGADKPMTLTLNLRKGFAASGEQNKTAGIDFKKTEAMEMPDYRSSRNLFNNPSFEQDFKDFTVTAGLGGRKIRPEMWDSVIIDNSQAKFGSKSLKIKTWCKDSECSPSPLNSVLPGNLSASPVPLEKGTHTISFYAKGDRPGEQKISVWCSDNAWAGKGFYSPLDKTMKTVSPSAQWERQSLTFEVKQSMPLTLNINAVSKNGDGFVWIDGLQLEKGPAATEFSSRPAEGNLITSSPENFLRPSDKVDARLEIISRPKAAGKVKVEVKSFFDDRLYSGEFDFKCGADGKAAVSLPLENLPRGINIVRAEYTLPSGERAYDFFRLAVMDFLENKHPLKNIFSINYGDALYFANSLKTLDRWKKIGVGAKAYPHWWEKEYSDIYNSRGVDVTNAYMSWCVKGKGKDKDTHYFYISDNLRDANNPASKLIDDFRRENKDGKLTDEYLARFKKVVAQNISRYPHIKMWAFGCEDDAKYPEWAGVTATDESVRQYAALQEAFFNAVKETNPDIKVFSGAPCNMSPAAGIKVIDRLLEATKGRIKYDCIGAHIYRNRPEAPDLDADTDALLKVMEKHGYKGTPVVWSEGMHYGPYEIPQWGIKSASWGAADFWFYGTLSYDMGWTEKVSAAWYARSWLVALKHSDKIVTATAGSDWNNFGLDFSGTPRAFQKVPNTLGRLLGDSKFVRDIRFAPCARCYIFEDGLKRPVAAVWSCHPKVEAGLASSPEVEISFSEGAVPEIFDLMEIRRKAVLRDGKIRAPVSPFPLFFRGRPGDTASFVPAFQNAALVSGDTIAPVNFAARPVSPGDMLVTAKNVISKEFKGELEISGKKISLSIPASKETENIFPLPSPLSDSAITDENIPAVVTTAGGSFRPDMSFRGFVTRRAKNKITVDGDIDDWREIPEIKLTNMRKSSDAEIVDEADFSGWFKTCWDSAGFYVCVKIRDDKFVHEEFPQTGSRWKNDSLQIYFDTLCDARMREPGKYDDNDYDYAVFPNRDGNSAVVYRYKSPDPQLTLATQAPSDNKTAPEIPCAFKQTSDGYVYEVFFPAKYILPVQLKKGVCFGLGIYVSDKDEEGGKVLHSLTTTPNGTGCWNNPQLWPAVLPGD
jgi:hypothetical protein